MISQNHRGEQPPFVLHVSQRDRDVIDTSDGSIIRSSDRPTERASLQDGPVGTTDSGRFRHGADRVAGLSGQQAVPLGASGLLHVDVCTIIQQPIIPHPTYRSSWRRCWPEQMCTFRSSWRVHLLHTGPSRASYLSHSLSFPLSECTVGKT